MVMTMASPEFENELADTLAKNPRLRDRPRDQVDFEAGLLAARFQGFVDLEREVSDADADALVEEAICNVESRTAFL
jgi:hypothetical protein